MDGNKEQLANGHDTDNNPLGLNGTAAGAVPPDASAAGAVGSLQAEIAAQGPEAAELHRRIASLFSDWLADEKAAAAEAEKRRKQYEADNVSIVSLSLN